MAIFWLGGHKQFLEEASVRHVYKFVSNLQKQIEVKAFSSDYAHQILCYGDYLLAFFSVPIGQETLLNEKIEFLSKLIEHCNSFSDKTVRNIFQKKSLGRLLICYSTKGGIMLRKEDWDLEACRKALDLSLQINGENTSTTVHCYMSIGCAEYAEKNYLSALDNIKKALDIMLPLCYEPDDFSLLGGIYFRKVVTHFQLGDIDLAVPSLQEALNMLRRGHLINEENEILAKLLFCLGLSQLYSRNLDAALETLERCLQVQLKLFKEKRVTALEIIECHQAVAHAHFLLNDRAKCKMYLEFALNIINTECTCKQLEKQFMLAKIYTSFIHFEIDENLYVDLLDGSLRSLHVVKEDEKQSLLIFYLTVASKQFKSGKHQSGIASLQRALEFDLDVSLRVTVEERENMVFDYVKMFKTLFKIAEPEFFIKVIDRALQLAETLPKHIQFPLLFHCYYCKGAAYIQMREFVFAIQLFEYTLTKLCEAASDKFLELKCRLGIAVAHYYEGKYKDALTSQYEALSIIKDLYPDGSEDEAESFHTVALIAQKLKTKKLIVSNLRLSYKMYSKVLGQNHPKTQASYLEYVRALMK